ncbi:hypothetical protein LTR95_008425 [Oleoguttula sp. CCFEE 5521]
MGSSKSARPTPALPAINQKTMAGSNRFDRLPPELRLKIFSAVHSEHRLIVLQPKVPLSYSLALCDRKVFCAAPPIPRKLGRRARRAHHLEEAFRVASRTDPMRYRCQLSHVLHLDRRTKNEASESMYQNLTVYFSHLDWAKAFLDTGSPKIEFEAGHTVEHQARINATMRRIATELPKVEKLRIHLPESVLYLDAAGWTAEQSPYKIGLLAFSTLEHLVEMTVEWRFQDEEDHAMGWAVHWRSPDGTWLPATIEENILAGCTAVTRRDDEIHIDTNNPILLRAVALHVPEWARRGQWHRMDECGNGEQDEAQEYALCFEPKAQWKWILEAELVELFAIHRQELEEQMRTRDDPWDPSAVRGLGYAEGPGDVPN